MRVMRVMFAVFFLLSALTQAQQPTNGSVVLHVYHSTDKDYRQQIEDMRKQCERAGLIEEVQMLTKQLSHTEDPVGYNKFVDSFTTGLLDWAKEDKAKGMMGVLFGKALNLGIAPYGKNGDVRLVLATAQGNGFLEFNTSTDMKKVLADTIGLATKILRPPKTRANGLNQT
jgi:hypothetical protein